MTYAVNWYNNKNRYDGTEIEADSIEELVNEIISLVHAKGIEKIAEIVELD